MADVSSMSDQARQEELVPTIIIGLGGTGKVMLSRLKARFYQRFGGKLPATVRLLCLDIDPKEEFGRIDGQIVKLGTEEFLDLGNVNVSEIKRELAANRFPEIDSWFDRRISLAESNLRKGAQQNRQLGRLALFWRLSEVREKLLAAIGQVTRQGLTAEAGRPDTDRPVEVNVFIISSICGGTGSGMFIDVAYVVKDLFERRGMGDLVSLIGVLVSPLVFRTANQENIQPNAFAALQELDYFMTAQSARAGQNGRISYPGGYQVDCRERPFKICYVIDAVASSGRTLEGIENLAPMLIDGIFLQVGSRLGAEAASLINNVKSLNTPERRTVYSSFGVASLVFPARQIIDICASRVAREVLVQTLLYAPDEAASRDINTQVSRFLDSKEFDRDRLLRRLSKDDRGLLVVGRLKDSDPLRENRLKKLEKAQVLTYVTGRVQELSAEYDVAGRRHIEGQQSAIVTEFRSVPKPKQKTLEEQVRDIVSDRQQGLPHAILFLSRLQTRLEELLQEFERLAAGAQTQRSQAESRRRLADQSFQDEVKASLKPLSFRRPDRARDEYIAAAQAYLDREFEYNALAGARAIVATLAENASSLLQRLSSLRNNLTWVRDSFLTEQENLAQRALADLDVVRRKPIIDPRVDIDSIYNHFHAEAQFRTSDDLLNASGGAWSLVDQRREAIAEQVFALAQGSLDRLKSITLEDVIQEKAGSTEPEQRRILPEDLVLAETLKYEPARWLETLRANADFFWNFNEAMERARDHRAERIMITGVRDTQRSIFSNIAAATGEGLASTDDPHLMTVLQMIHGFMFDSMSQYRSYYETYKQARRRGDALYVYPEFNTGDGNTRRLFIRAHALGTIFKGEERGKGLIAWQDGNYLVIPSKDGEQPILLGEGTLKDALTTFAAQPLLQEEMRKRVETLERALRVERVELLRQTDAFADRFVKQLDSGDLIWGEELTISLRDHISKM